MVQPCVYLFCGSVGSKKSRCSLCVEKIQIYTNWPLTFSLNLHRAKPWIACTVCGYIDQWMCAFNQFSRPCPTDRIWVEGVQAGEDGLTSVSPLEKRLKEHLISLDHFQSVQLISTYAHNKDTKCKWRHWMDKTTSYIFMIESQIPIGQFTMMCLCIYLCAGWLFCVHFVFLDWFSLFRFAFVFLFPLLPLSTFSGYIRL